VEQPADPSEARDRLQHAPRDLRHLARDRLRLHRPAGGDGPRVSRQELADAGRGRPVEARYRVHGGANARIPLGAEPGGCRGKPAKLQRDGQTRRDLPADDPRARDVPGPRPDRTVRRLVSPFRIDEGRGVRTDPGREQEGGRREDPRGPLIGRRDDAHRALQSGSQALRRRARSGDRECGLRTLRHDPGGGRLARVGYRHHAGVGKRNRQAAEAGHERDGASRQRRSRRPGLLDAAPRLG
jgi:hypothetical protein